jgi:hypothetical protein
MVPLSLVDVAAIEFVARDCTSAGVAIKTLLRCDLPKSDLPAFLPSVPTD